MASSHGALTTALTGANNDMVFTARFPGPASSRIKVAYLDPGEETAAESVSVDYDEATKVTTINVTLRSVSAVLSTAAEVKTAVEANAIANALVTIAASGGDTLATSVIALAATALSAGTPDATTGGYDDADEMEDDGWELSNWTAANGDVVYAAEILVDGEAIQVASATADGRLKAAWTYKDAFFAHEAGNPSRINGGGTRD